MPQTENEECPLRSRFSPPKHTQHDESVDEEVLEVVPPGPEGLLGLRVTEDLVDEGVAEGSHRVLVELAVSVLVDVAERSIF